VVWEDYPLEKDYTWEPIENLYGHEDLAQTYEQWMKTDNERKWCSLVGGPIVTCR